MDNTVIVVLDTDLTPDLIEEGFVREIISKVQTMRKEAGFEVAGHITVYVQNNKSISSVLKANETFIKSEVFSKNKSAMSRWKVRLSEGMEYHLEKK
ncbi:DUF5915 domain-containing protein [Hungatella sp.]|uniref:DUF5915 domain-containing protein n=1 Tax=Hungatella sp. TaxID=2613924 RepID=UPI0039952966